MAKTATGSAATRFISAFEDKTKATFQMLPAEKIVRHPRNTAAKNDTDEEIAELAADIEVNGILHPLLVNHITEKDEYRIVSGERRYRATTECLHWTLIPCMVREDLSEEEETLALLSANLETREYSAADKLELCREAEQALIVMKERGEYRGGIQKGVAELLGVSTRSIRKYQRALESAGDDVRSVKSITEAASTASQKAEGYSAFLPDEDMLPVLQTIYSAAKVEEYYREKLPTPKDAVAFLKPIHGYSGAGGYSLKDGRRLSYTKTRNNIAVSLDDQQAIIKYPDAERVIRAAIVDGVWCEKAKIAAKKSAENWSELNDVRDDLIRQDVQDVAPNQRPSAAFTSKNRSCQVTAAVLDPIAKASSGFGVKIAEAMQYLLPGDYDYLICAIDRIAKDIKDLQFEFELDALVVEQSISEDEE